MGCSCLETQKQAALYRFQVVRVNSTVASLDQQMDIANRISGLETLVIGKEAFESVIYGVINKLTGKMTEISDTFRAPTMSVEEKWRFIPLAVIFGLTILLSAILAIAVWRMSWPKATAFTVMLLWLAVALLLLLGAGRRLPYASTVQRAGINGSSPCRPLGWWQNSVH